MLCLQNRSVFALYGPDAQSFLQGIITNDIYKFEQHPIYAFVLNSKGRYLYDFFFVKHCDQILVDYECSNKLEIIRLLKKYKIGMRVSLVPTKYLVYSSLVQTDVENVAQFIDPRSEKMGYRIFSINNLNCLYIQSEYDIRRIKNIVPDGTKDLISGKSFPFECDINHAIDLKKGCYVGQEVVARTIGKGVIRKKLFVVECSMADFLPQAGVRILDQDNKVIGEMRSSVSNIGLALINIEDARFAIAREMNVYAGCVKIKVHGISQ